MKRYLILPFLFIMLFSCSDDETIIEKSEFGCVEKVKADCGCTLDYNPVCGCNGITYSNACAAECASITAYEAGACLN